MNKTSSLMLLAAGLTVMPLAVAESPSAAQHCSAAVPAMPPFAEDFAPAALLPADVDLALVLPNIQSFGVGMQEIPFKGVVVGFAKGSADSYATVSTCQLLHTLPLMVQDAADEWKESALESLGDIIVQSAACFAQESADKLAGEVGKFTLHPIYLLISPQAGAEEVLEQTLTAYTAMLAMSLQEQEGVERVAVNDFSGIKISGAVLAQQIDPDDPGPGGTGKIREDLSRRTFYLLAGMKKGNAAIILCENPEEIQWASSPEQSVLTKMEGEPWNSGDAAAEATPWAFFVNSPAMTRAFCANGTDAYIGLLKHVGTLFRSIAEKESAQAAVFHAAAAGLDTIANGIAAEQAQTLFQPTTVAVWETPGHVHFNFRGDAQGCTYKPGKLRFSDIAAAPQNALYFESTGVNFARKPDYGKMISAADDVIKGVARTLRPEKKEELGKCMQEFSAYLPELKNAWQGICTIGGGLGNTVAFVVDSGQETQQAAFSLCAAVGDRAKIEQGAAAFGSAFRNMLALSEKEEGGSSQCSVEVKIAGDTSVCKITGLNLPAGVCPNVIMNDSYVAIGTSPEFNATLIRSAGGNTDFAGCVFSVNFAELSKVVNSLVPPSHCGEADASAPEEEGLAANLDEEDDVNEGDFDDDDLDEEDFDEEDDDDALMGTVPDKEFDEQIRDAVNTAAEYAEGVKGSSTIENGVNTLHVDVILKK